MANVVNDTPEQGRLDLREEAWGGEEPMAPPEVTLGLRAEFTHAYGGNVDGLVAGTTKADRYNRGKPQLSYLLDAPIAFLGYSRVMEHGARKYGRYNWRKGLDEDEIIDSMIRHLQARRAGEILDRETGVDHYFHAMCNAVFLSEQHSSLENLDCPPYIADKE